jgi:hypothetical protein
MDGLPPSKVLSVKALQGEVEARIYGREANECLSERVRSILLIGEQPRQIFGCVQGVCELLVGALVISELPSGHQHCVEGGKRVVELLPVNHSCTYGFPIRMRSIGVPFAPGVIRIGGGVEPLAVSRSVLSQRCNALG